MHSNAVWMWATGLGINNLFILISPSLCLKWIRKGKIEINYPYSSRQNAMTLNRGKQRRLAIVPIAQCLPESKQKEMNKC